MTVVQIRKNIDLINYLDRLESSTNKFFDSGEKSVKGLTTALVEFHSDLEFNESMCRKIASTFKYFRGVVEGNGKTFTVCSDKTTSLFSSIYYSVVRNLNIRNSHGSRGLLLADDAMHSVFENIKIEGTISVEESSGGLLRTGQNNQFTNCSINIQTGGKSSEKVVEQVSTEPLHFGGLLGVDLGNNKFVGCTASGRIVGEVAVGGFCAIARDSIFENCKAENLKVIGKRETGLFAGRSSKSLTFTDCDVSESILTANTYVGFMVGKSTGDIRVDKLILDDSFINPSAVASFIGGIAGITKSLALTNSHISGGISGNFIIAGVCPDARDAVVANNVFDLGITATGYLPMMTHVYPLVKDEYLTTTEEDITFIETDNRKNINIMELTAGGTINPFKESFL